MKSLWFVLYDLISIAAHKELKSVSVFCQVNGFFFAVGIEAADAAVFLIALHSTVYIFWPNGAGGGSGLYPYRRGAYAFFALWPILMASLAFVTGTSAYVNTGQNCYLSMKPWWYRTALSWIPRYVNLLLILLMYGSSYLYIRVMLNRYSRRNSEIPVGRPDRIVPPTPPLMAHNLIATSPAGSMRSSSSPQPVIQIPNTTPSRPSEHLKARESVRGKLDMFYSGTRLKGNWSWAGFEPASSAAHTPDPSSAGVSPFGGIAFPAAPTIEPVQETAKISQASVPVEIPKLAFLKRNCPTNTPSSTKSSTGRGRPSPSFLYCLQAHHARVEDYFTDSANVVLGRAHTGSKVHIKKVLEEGPALILDADSGKSSPLISLDQATFESGGISRSRERLRRQLRYLFIYPAVYACIWIFPFLNDLSIFNQSLRRHPPYWLALCSLISLSIQGLVDSLVFCAREKPWRHLRGGFWQSLGLDFFKDWKFTLRKDSGRTREEMFNDSQRARSRRDEELELENECRGSSGGRRLPTAGSRNWWDADFEGSGQQRRDTASEEEAGPSGQRHVPLAESLSRIVRRVSPDA